jgi:hypothetical protein
MKNAERDSAVGKQREGAEEDSVVFLQAERDSAAEREEREEREERR